MQAAPLPDRLTLAEIEFCRSGNSREIQAWNAEFALLIDEYYEAIQREDEGLISDSVCEVRKCLSGLGDALTCDLAGIVEGLEGGPEWGK